MRPDVTELPVTPEPVAPEPVAPEPVAPERVAPEPVGSLAFWWPGSEVPEERRRGALAGCWQGVRGLGVGFVANGLALLVIIGVVVLLLAHPSHHSDQTAQVPSRQVFSPPVRLSPGTAYVETVVLPSGDLEVTHWMHSRTGLSEVTLEVPHVAGLLPGDVAVSHLTVAADGVVLAHGDAAPDSPDTPAALSSLVPPGTHDLYVSYRLTDVIQQDSTVPGRGLARLTALTVGTDASIDRSTLKVKGAKVLALACSAPTPKAIPVPCGSEQGGSWSVRLDRHDVQDRVMAQFDLG